jgi:DNA invertase Pin-like site-specific DNA recombinase
MRAATYARLSDDDSSIPDQQAKARKFAEDRDWQVVGEFKDDHASAFRVVERKGFDALLAAAEAGMIDAIIARHHDRLTRNLKDYDRLIEVCARRGVMVHYYAGGALDFRTSEGGFMETINTAIAQRGQTSGASA